MLKTVNWETESRKERNQNINSGKFWSQFPRIKAITEVEVALRESSIREKNCAEIAALFHFPSAVVHGGISQKAPHRFPAHVTTVNIPTWRWPCSSGVLDEGFRVWAVLTPVCYPGVQHPTSGLEETICSWEKRSACFCPRKIFVPTFPVYGWGNISQPMTFGSDECVRSPHVL